MPFPVKAIQVDGGCEFKAEFEQACRARGIVLYELPPKRPQLNSAWRYEFYAVFDLPTRIDELTPFVNAFQHRYNHHRLHGALAPSLPTHSSQTTVLRQAITLLPSED
jgi:transposase InsO family protein